MRRSLATLATVASLMLWSTSATAQADDVTRIAGIDRIATAIAASQDMFDAGGADAAVLVRSDDFADATAAAPLAHSRTAPLLLTPRESLDPRVETELNRVLDDGATIYLLGGTAALSSAVAQRVAALGYVVDRVAGADRYATAVAVAKEVGDPAALLYANGLDFPDALVSGPAAAHRGGVVLLTAGASLPAVVAEYANSVGDIPTFAVGAPAASAAPTAQPIVGSDRHDTARKVANHFFAAPSVAGFAGGDAWPDGLSGGAHIARAGGPLLFVQRGSLPPPTEAYVAGEPTIAEGYLYGGPLVVHAEVEAMLEALI